MAVKTRNGRALPFTPELAERLIAHAVGGLTDTAASALEGLHRNILGAWVRRGLEDPSGEFGAFAQRYDEAQQVNAARSLAVGTRGIPMLTPEVRAIVLETVRRGNFVETAAALAGISTATLHGWLRRGAREETGEYAELTRAVRLAQAEAEAEGVSAIQSAARSDWKAVAWLLARLSPERWGDRAKVEVSGHVEHSASELQERLARKVQALVVSVTRAELPEHGATSCDDE